ncbi:hypothetical protein L484_010405 [Morus notabilis]|uniref:Poly(A) RNA polymerase mitochondrial-like central palm domain-containing protein n=1 Tax=Morus notabilis TaxID=981085 RepID=W9SA58_9ROSA|nr:hypothetical protein L484_010405 [Morus notabilis]
MNPNGVLLEHTLKEILAVLQPESNDWVARFQVIEELRRVVDSLESMRGATVEPFGSFVSNLFTRSGDLDISIELANGSFISSSGKKHKQKLLRALMEAMRQRGGWNKYQCIPNARVPILKVQSNIQNISCDISVDNLQAQMKSKMLLWITEIDTRFRDMVLLVKEWAKAHNINNSKTGTFNSYSLSLLVVFHFQTCVPAIFPPLKDIYPGNIADDLQGLRANAERQISETCAANIARFRSQRGRAVNHSSLSDLFISFLSKIEDPFGQPENSARAVNASQLTKISEAFQSTYRRLVSRNQNQNDFLAPLVRQQTSQLIPRNQRYNPHSVYQPTRPQWLTADFSHPPQYARHGSGRHQQTRPQVAYLTTRVPNARAYQVQNQQQQLWRPRSRR